MALYKDKKEILYMYYGKQAVMYVYKKARLVYEAVAGYLFSTDGFALKSNDGYMIKCKDQ